MRHLKNFMGLIFLKESEYFTLLIWKGFLPWDAPALAPILPLIECKRIKFSSGIYFPCRNQYVLIEVCASWEVKVLCLLYLKSASCNNAHELLYQEFR